MAVSYRQHRISSSNSNTIQPTSDQAVVPCAFRVETARLASGAPEVSGKSPQPAFHKNRIEAKYERLPTPVQQSSKKITNRINNLPQKPPKTLAPACYRPGLGDLY